MATVNLSSIITPANVLTASNAETLTNKTINIASNTLTGVQSTLVSGTSIKTVNSTSLLGSGNIAISAGFTLGTPVVTTSGTSIDFTGIPAGVKQIVVTFKGVSTSSFSQMLIRLGDAGGIETTGYVSIAVKLENAQAVANSNDTDGFRINLNGGSPVFHGTFICTLENSSTFSWTTIGFLGDTSAGIFLGTTGSKSLSQELTQVRITTVNGTDTFDAGEINIAYI